MSVSLGASSAVISGTTSITISTMPAGSAGDMMLLVAGTNHPTNDAATPTLSDGTWTQLLTYVNTGGGAQGASSGNRRVTIWYKIRTASETGPTVDLAGADVMLANVYNFTKTNSASWSLGHTTGEDSTSGTDVSVTGSAGVDLVTGDVLFAGVITNRSTTQSAQTLAATGATFGTVTEIRDSGTATGNDMRLVSVWAPVSSGSSNTAPTYTATAAATTTATGWFVRLSDRSPTITGSLATTTETDSAVAAGAKKSRGVVTNIEADSVVGIGSRKTRAISLVTQTEVAQPAGRSKARAVGTATESGASVAVARIKRRAVVVVLEDDAAIPFAQSTGFPISPATSTETAVAIGARKTKACGTALETDLARTITFTVPTYANVVTETDTAMPIRGRKVRTLGVVTEAGGSQSIRPAHSRSIGVTVEADSIPSSFGRKKRLTPSPVGSPEESRALVVTVPLYRFEPPTYQREWRPPGLVIRRPRFRLTESQSVVRIGGVLTTVKGPTSELLESAGVAGEDYFLGGRVYIVSFSVAQELLAAGFSVTEI